MGVLNSSMLSNLEDSIFMRTPRALRMAGFTTRGFGFFFQRSHQKIQPFRCFSKETDENLRGQIPAIVREGGADKNNGIPPPPLC